MAYPAEPATGRRTRDRSTTDTPAETGPGAPDDAIGPQDRTAPEQIEFADSPEGRRIERKLRAEALARRSAEDEAMVADPTGHA